MSAVTSATGKMIIVSKWCTSPFNTSSCENKSIRLSVLNPYLITAAAAAKSRQSCPILCDPIAGSPPGSAIPGIFQARTLEWVAIAFSVSHHYGFLKLIYPDAWWPLTAVISANLDISQLALVSSLSSLLLPLALTSLFWSSVYLLWP